MNIPDQPLRMMADVFLRQSEVRLRPNARDGGDAVPEDLFKALPADWLERVGRVPLPRPRLDVSPELQRISSHCNAAAVSFFLCHAAKSSLKLRIDTMPANGPLPTSQTWRYLHMNEPGVACKCSNSNGSY